MVFEKKKLDIKMLLIVFLLGHIKDQPFDKKIIEEARIDLRLAPKKGAAGDWLPREGDLRPAFEIRLIQAFREASEDPDAYFCQWLATGVRLGFPKRRLVFDRKTKWRWTEPTEELHGEWQHDYPSLGEHAPIVQTNFEDEGQTGWMCQMTVAEAISEWGHELLIAAAGAIAMNGKEGEVRVIYDGSNGIPTNPGIRVSDLVKYVTASDGKSVMSECAEKGGSHYSLQLDVSGVHRQVGVVREDWGRQACQVRGTAAEASKAAMKLLAESERQGSVTQGCRVKLTPRIGCPIWRPHGGVFGGGPLGQYGRHLRHCVGRLLVGTSWGSRLPPAALLARVPALSVVSPLLS